MDKEKKAVERIKMASEMSLQYHEKPLICTYSGGKDSDVMLELFKHSGVPFEVQHSLTTADAPPTVRHILKKFKDLEASGIKCTINKPVYKGQRVSMWTLIPQKGIPPTRLVRYCCSVLKEKDGKNSFIATGVRWSESNQRKARNEIETLTNNKSDSVRISFNEVFLDDNTESRRLIEHCKVKGKMTVNPIIDWTDRDVWDFLTSEKIEVNPLYCQGYTRVGCIGCPMASRKGQLKWFADFPAYKTAYIRAFDRMIARNKEKGKNQEWKTGKEVFRWWTQDPNIEGQLSFFNDEEYELYKAE